MELERRALVEVRLPHAHACLGRLRQGVPSGAAPLADAPRMAPRLYAGWRRLRGDYGPQFRGMGRSLKGSAGRASPRQAPEGFAELYLFPGVEISVSGGVHVLALFDSHTTTEKIAALLGEVGLTGTFGRSDDVTTKSFPEVISEMSETAESPFRPM